MQVFLSLLYKLIPLYITILLGFIAGKYFGVKKESVAAIVIYLVTPVIFFNGIYTTTITGSSMSLPIVIFAISCIMCLLFYGIGGLFWKDSNRNMLAFISGDGNSGYFGLPVAMLLLPNHIIGLYIFTALGILVYENTLGVFIAARGNYTVKDSLKKLFSLPLIYAVMIGFICNLIGIHFGSIYADVVSNFKGAYTILGMMLIGLGLTGITQWKFDFKFISLSFLARFFVWPLLVFCLLLLDSTVLKIYNADVRHILILLSVIPLAANGVAFATILKSHPEKVAVTILLSTLFALFYIPLVATLFFR